MPTVYLGPFHLRSPDPEAMGRHGWSTILPAPESSQPRRIERNSRGPNVFHRACVRRDGVPCAATG